MSGPMQPYYGGPSSNIPNNSNIIPPQSQQSPRRRGIFGAFARWWNAGCWPRALMLGLGIVLIPVLLICSCLSFGLIFDLTPGGQQYLASARATDAASTATAATGAETQAVIDASATSTAYTYALEHPTPTPAPTNTPAPTATTSPHWVTVKHYSGSGDFESDPVYIAFNDRIGWSMTPDSNNSYNSFVVNIESVTTHAVYSVADEYSSTHVKTGDALVPYGDTYYVKVSSFGMQGWSIDIQVFK